MTYEELWHRLTPLYEPGEAKAIVRLLLDECYGLSWADVLGGKVTELSANDQTELKKIMLRLEKGEPIQYIIGVADFCGRQFHVEPGVLIPRPETAELCQLILATESHGQTRNIREIPCHSDTNILDIGTGSGCIAITLALELPEAKVTAWDISDEALRIGLVNSVVPQAELMDKALELANQIAANAPLAVKAAKLCINAEYDMPMDEAVMYESGIFGKCFATRDQKNGMKAFLNKEKPVFTGK